MQIANSRYAHHVRHHVSPGTARCGPASSDLGRGTWLARNCLISTITDDILDPEAREFYCHTLNVFEQANLDVLIGGAYAFARYTGIERHTKDFDVFVRDRDFERTLGALRAAGYLTEIPFPHWLGKAHHGEYYVDVIYGSGNGIARVDDDWFAHATQEHVFDVPVRLCPPEEIIWSKAFIQERERFDGADVAHLLLACGERMDWQRLLDRFGPNWRVVFAPLVVLGYLSQSPRPPSNSG